MARTPKHVEFDKEITDQVVGLRDDEGQKWSEISDAVGESVGKCMLVYMVAKCPKKDRIKNATAEDIVRLRDEESLSWGEIVARVAYPESSCRSMYTEATGNSTKGNRIGKGGRYPGDESPDGESKPKAKKSAAKKTAAKGKVKGGKAPADMESKLEGMSADEVKEAISLRGIKVHDGEGGHEVIRVKAVKRVTATTVALQDETGAARTIKRAAVFAITKKPVLSA